MKHIPSSAQDRGPGTKERSPRHQEVQRRISLKMNEVRRAVCWVRWAQVLLLGITAGDQLTVPRNAINVTIGHAVLLPVAVTLTNQFTQYTVEWEVGNQSILYHTVRSCTLDSLGYLTGILDDTFKVYPAYSGRVEFYKLNSSLLIYNVQANDSGIYRVSFSTTSHTTTQHITLRVLGEQPSDSAAGSTWKPWIFAFRTVLCFLPLAALLIIIHVWG